MTQEIIKSGPKQPTTTQEVIDINLQQSIVTHIT